MSEVRLLLMNEKGAVVVVIVVEFCPFRLADSINFAQKFYHSQNMPIRVRDCPNWRFFVFS